MLTIYKKLRQRSSSIRGNAVEGRLVLQSVPPCRLVPKWVGELTHADKCVGSRYTVGISLRHSRDSLRSLKMDEANDNPVLRCGLCNKPFDKGKLSWSRDAKSVLIANLQNRLSRDMDTTVGLARLEVSLELDLVTIAQAGGHVVIIRDLNARGVGPRVSNASIQ